MDCAERDRRWPEPPPWRTFAGEGDLPTPPEDEAEARRRLGAVSVHRTVDPMTVSVVNAGIYLCRPLIVTGRPGSGKSALAYLIARELGLGRVLRWPVTSRSTLRSGLYQYDAFSHAQAIGSGGDADLGNYIHLGPLGTAFLPHRLPRVLLIDEMDKSDIDLPHDLLSIFEDGEYSIHELIRIRDRQQQVVVHTDDPGGRAPVRNGIVRCHAFPVVIIASNGEREFPPAFLRRCLTLTMGEPDADRLAEIVAAHFDHAADDVVDELIRLFTEARGGRELATDQLLNAIRLATSGVFDGLANEQRDELLNAIWHRLAAGEPA
jgi:MoxR-like ATPase